MKLNAASELQVRLKTLRANENGYTAAQTLILFGPTVSILGIERTFPMLNLCNLKTML